ncbi:MAG TPA: DMT family transporter, partial [Chitinophagales bacterium]|nr:DMT family transporter [Chitinophagales bacterium]
MPTTRANSYNSQNIAMLAALTLIWGSSYILIKRGLIAFSPIQLASLRISITCLCSLPVLFRALKAVPRHKYFTLLQMGLFSSGIPAFLFALSMTHSSSSVNGILNSLSPLWTILIGYFFYRVAITRQKVLGVVIGFLGAIVLVLGKKGGVFKFDIVYSFLPVVATFCYGLGTNITKQKLQDENPLYCTAIAMSMIGLPAIVIAFYTEVPAVIVSGTAWVSVAAVAALSVFGTFIAWVIFYR